MAGFVRGKQAGVHGDFSTNIDPQLFHVEQLCRYGIPAQITEIVYDPVQSLLAVGTARAAGGPGQVYVFGRQRISSSFSLKSRKASVRELQFCAEKLICLDDQNDLHVFSLDSRKVVTTYSPPGTATCIASDPTLDYVFIGLHTGEIIAFDMDREIMTPFRIPCLWAEKDPRARHVPVVSLEFHPRDIGKILIGYDEAAVVYSFKQNESKKFFRYEIPRGAPGGAPGAAPLNTVRAPKLTHAIWHPTGTFVLTGHQDSSLVIWDPKDGRKISARTATDVRIDQAGAAAGNIEKGPKLPLLKIKWCANQDPDDTGILIAGGTSAGTNGLTFLELGRTPNYTTTSWVQLSDHFENPKRQRVLPTPPGAQVCNICMIPRTSPWFNGAQDPIALIALFSTGAMSTMSFPSGYPISPTNQLSISLTFVHPFITYMNQSSIQRARWLGLTENRLSGPKVLTGGAEATRPMRRQEQRNLVHTAHADGTIRFWDAGHADEIENELMLQADVSRAVGDGDRVQICHTSLSGESGELAAGTEAGEVIVFKWQRNPHPSQEGRSPAPPAPGSLTDVSDCMDPNLVEGFHPFTRLDQGGGAVTALKVSDVGFIGAGFKDGSVVAIDMRGPAIIFSEKLSTFAQAKQKQGAFRRKSEQTNHAWPTIIEFSVMTLEDESYSSILMHVGTCSGQVATLKILPGQGGRYTVSFAGIVQLDDAVVSVSPLNTADGKPAHATPQAVANLRQGIKTDGVLLAVTRSGARVFRAPAAKGAQKSWDNVFCDQAAVVKCFNAGYALVALFGDGTARSYTIPGLKEIASARMDQMVDIRKLSSAEIMDTGEIIAWTGPSEIALLSVWHSTERVLATDRLFNPEALIPPRPTISNFQWVSGTQYITPAELDILIGGTNRPPSKTQIAQAREGQMAQKQAARSAYTRNATSGTSVQTGSDEGYLAYAQRQMNERMERLGNMGDSMDRLGETSAGWAEGVNDFVNRQKRNMVMGAVKSKFGM